MSKDVSNVSAVERASADLFMPPQVRKVLDTPVLTVAGAGVNGWTAGHAATGWAFGRAGVDFGASLALHEAWEQWQSITGSTPDTTAGVVDRLIDTSAFVGGWVGAKLL